MFRSVYQPALGQKLTLFLFLFRKQCHAEWFRYIQFHNMAAEVAPSRVHVMFYENYTDDFDESVRQLFDFLELDIVEQQPCEWHGAGKSYANYLSAAWQRQAAAMMRDLATPAAWELVRYYLEPYLPDDEGGDDPPIGDSPDEAVPQVAWLLSFPNSVRQFDSSCVHRNGLYFGLT